MHPAPKSGQPNIQRVASQVAFSGALCTKCHALLRKTPIRYAPAVCALATRHAMTVDGLSERLFTVLGRWKKQISGPCSDFWLGSRPA
jgi:hypothetical protein